MLKGRDRMNDWKLRALKAYEINARTVFLKQNQNFLLQIFKQKLGHPW